METKKSEPKKKPRIMRTDRMKPGYVLVKEFYIVGFVVDGSNGFFVCGDNGAFTQTSRDDRMYPCIGTSREEAEKQFAMAAEAAKRGYPKGAVVLIEFKAGQVGQIAKIAGDEDVTAIVRGFRGGAPGGPDGSAH